MKVSFTVYIIAIIAAIAAVFILAFLQISSSNFAGSAACNPMDASNTVRETHNNADGTATIIETNLCTLCTTIAEYNKDNSIVSSRTNCR